MEKDSEHAARIPAVAADGLAGIGTGEWRPQRCEHLLLPFHRPRATVPAVLRRRRMTEPLGAELAALADGSLAAGRRADVEALVDESPALAERLAEQERAIAYVQSAVAGTEAPAGLRARIEAQRRPRRPAPTRRLALAAAGATIVVAAAVAGLAVMLSSSSSSGEQFAAALAPTGALPGATGKATLTETPSGWRVRLHAAGLPHLAHGRFYEAWLRNRAGVLVPIGTFNDGRKVTLWAGVEPKRSWTLTVTRERADNDQSSSGDKVLVGTVLAAR